MCDIVFFRKGQTGLLVQAFGFIIIVVLLMLVIRSIAVNNKIETQNEKIIKRNNDLFAIARNVLNDPIFVRKDRTFDASKLTAVSETMSCDELRNYFNNMFFMNVQTEDFDYIVDKGYYRDMADILCNSGNYPDCNSWNFCITGNIQDMMDYEAGIARIPVLVYYYNEDISKESVKLATLTIGIIYSKV